MDIDYELFGKLLGTQLDSTPTIARSGKVFEVVGTLIRVAGMNVQLGEMCELRDATGRVLQQAEVIGLSRGVAMLSPFEDMAGISTATRAFGTGRQLTVRVGEGLKGRVITGLGAPMDGRGPIVATEERPVMASPPDPMARRAIEAVMPTGVRCIDALLTLAEGQRVGIFAPAGVGKSTLMGMLARGATSDVNVIALIGERGREVKEFIEDSLGPEGMARSVVVCATSDRSAIERAKAAHLATAVAEYYRDKGQRVLLMMDSLTRFARALRETGLARGESPARRGFPPSVFAEIPRLLERTGNSDRGSITALYTVLAEDDSGSDPISEEVRGILDGHIVLSRAIAARGQYPAIDVLGSVSRVMNQVVMQNHARAAVAVRKLMAKYAEMETLVQMGEYQRGNDADADKAVDRIGAIRAFLSQETNSLIKFNDSVGSLARLAG